MDIEALYSGYGWIIFTYPDSSKIVFRTTLNPEVLINISGHPQDDKLFDFDKQIWKTIPTAEGVTVSVSNKYPEDLSEVDKFANRFI